MAPSPHPASELARKLDGIFVSIALMINAQFRILGPWTSPIWTRLNRANRRLAALLAHLVAGRLPRPHAPRAPGLRRPVANPDPLAPAPLPPLPRVQLWLVRLLGYHAAGYGSQLQTVLHDPATIAILAQVPSAGRTLRPFCRLLGVILPEVLQLAPRPRPRPRQARPPAMRPAQPRPAQPSRPKSLPSSPPWYPPTPQPLPPARPVGIDTAGIEYAFEPT